MYDSSDLKKGRKIKIDDDPYVITQFEFVKPGKGQALYKCKLKNMITGVMFDKTFRSGEKIEEADLENIDMEYLYNDGQNFCFMNTSTYEQEFLTYDQVGDVKNFLKDNTICNILLFNKKPIEISLPIFVELRVKTAEPWVKGDTASGSTKPVTLETGHTVNVPPFINENEIVKIDTRTGEYVERVKG